MQNLLTQAYKYLTLGILGLIFAAMAGYVGIFIFFLLSASWGAPVILTSGHEHVAAMRRNWLELKLRQAELEGRLQILRTSARELDVNRLLGEGWVLSLEATIERELGSARIEQKYLAEALAAIAADQTTVKELAKGLLATSRPERELKAGIIDRQRFLTEKLQETELIMRVTTLAASLGELTVKERQARERIASLESLRRFSLQFKPETMKKLSPDAAARLHTQTLSEIVSGDFVRVDRTVRDASLASAYSADSRQVKMQLDELGVEAENLRVSLVALEKSVLVKAFSEPTVVMFAPYTNLKRFERGTPVYACYLFLIWCPHVGTTGNVVDGEVVVPHPLFGRQIRGQFVEVRLTDQAAGQYDVLHVGGAPLLL